MCAQVMRDVYTGDQRKVRSQVHSGVSVGSKAIKV